MKGASLSRQRSASLGDLEPCVFATSAVGANCWTPAKYLIQMTRQVQPRLRGVQSGYPSRPAGAVGFKVSA